LEGYRDWKERGLQRPACVDKDAEEYQTEADTVGAFIFAGCYKNKAAKTLTSDLYSAYERWCSSSGLTPVSKTIFGKTLGQKGYEPFKASKGNGWVGIGLSSSLSNDNRIDHFAA
jgi:putative DNA primase/helicase